MVKHKISQTKYSWKKNAGVYFLLAPFLLAALMGLSTLVVDMGMMRVAHAELQNTTDAAALAAVNALTNGNSAAQTAAINSINKNTIIGNLTANNVQIQFGTWDTITNIFTATNNSPNAVKVSASVSPPLFFISFFSSQPYNVSTESIASLIGGPRDIIFVVDLSPGMSQFSQLSAFPTLSVNTIVNNLRSVYDALGLPQYGNLTWTPRLLLGADNTIIDSLGLKNIPYPYPSGSWKDYVNYVKRDAALLATGYQNQYGYLTFVNYLISQQPQYSQTPTLWKTPEQPLQTAKDSLDYFLTNSVSSADQIGLVTYNQTQGNTALLEQSLTTNFGAISSILDGNRSSNVPGRQAAHFSTQNDLLSAMKAAINELNANGRQDSQWIIFILTAGQFSNSGFSAIINEAQNAASNNITINVVTLGANGNVSLMQQIAQITGGTSITPGSTDFGDSLGQIASINGKPEIVQ